MQANRYYCFTLQILAEFSITRSKLLLSLVLSHALLGSLASALCRERALARSQCTIEAAGDGVFFG